MNPTPVSEIVMITPAMFLCKKENIKMEITFHIYFYIFKMVYALSLKLENVF